jgi:hypothetical protein
MATDWQARETERQRLLAEERICLLSISEEDALKMLTPQWYQWMRYQREIEAHEQLMKLRDEMKCSSSLPLPAKKKQYSKKRWGYE